MTEKLTRKEAKERSRQRLIDATVQILAEDGQAGLTTGKVAARASLSQPSFYVHFKDMDDIVQVACDQFGERVRKGIRKNRDSAGYIEGRVDGTGKEAAALRAMLDEPSWSIIMYRHRRDETTLLGQYAAKFFANTREDFKADLIARKADKLIADVDLFVELVTGATNGVMEALLDGRITDVEQALRGILRMSFATFASLAEKHQGTGTAASNGTKVAD